MAGDIREVDRAARLPVRVFIHCAGQVRWRFRAGEIGKAHTGKQARRARDEAVGGIAHRLGQLGRLRVSPTLERSGAPKGGEHRRPLVPAAGAVRDRAVLVHHSEASAQFHVLSAPPGGEDRQVMGRQAGERELRVA